MTIDIDPRTEARFTKMQPFGSGSTARPDPAMLPDGPRFNGLLQSIMLMRFRHQWIPHLRRKYGDVFSIKILPEGRWMVFFHKPEHVREIFAGDPDRKSTRLNSSHSSISYAVFCLKKKKQK